MRSWLIAPKTTYTRRVIYPHLWFWLIAPVTATIRPVVYPPKSLCLIVPATATTHSAPRGWMPAAGSLLLLHSWYLRFPAWPQFKGLRGTVSAMRDSQHFHPHLPTHVASVERSDDLPFPAGSTTVYDDRLASVPRRHAYHAELQNTETAVSPPFLRRQRFFTHQSASKRGTSPERGRPLPTR